jgi:hypothetical protein
MRAGLFFVPGMFSSSSIRHWIFLDICECFALRMRGTPTAGRTQKITPANALACERKLQTGC